MFFRIFSKRRTHMATILVLALAAASWIGGAGLGVA
jgi:hypothetical protein